MSSQPLPLVSIIIPSYKPQHFEIALTSALAQTYERKEIIVSDDCPTDAIEQICRKYPGIQHSRNPQPGGRRNMARLLTLAGGEYIKYLFDDDILHPLCVSRMVEAMSASDSFKLAFSARDLIDAQNRITGKPRHFSAKGGVARIEGFALAHKCLTTVQNPVGEFSTVMFRKSDVVDASGTTIFFDYCGTPLIGLADVATWLKLCEQGDVIYFDEPLSYFRMHPGSNTSANTTPEYRACVTDWLLLAKHALRDPRFTTADKLTCYANIRNHFAKRLHLFADLAVEIAEIDQLMEQLREPATPR